MPGERKDDIQLKPRAHRGALGTKYVKPARANIACKTCFFPFGPLAISPGKNHRELQTIANGFPPVHSSPKSVCFASRAQARDRHLENGQWWSSQNRRSACTMNDCDTRFSPAATLPLLARRCEDHG
jgi:hypothetical protein